MIQASDYSEITDCNDNSEYFHVRNNLWVQIFTEILYIHIYMCVQKANNSQQLYIIKIFGLICGKLSSNTKLN